MHAHLLGFPRMGAARELKWALERHWRGEVGAKVLCSVADDLKRRHWALQAEAGMTIVPVGDFSLYDHMLDAAVMLGAVPSRFRGSWPSRGPDLDLDGYFRLARGDAERGIAAMEMTKWFDTNYHYIVPEFDASTVFAPDASGLLADLDAVAGMGLMAKAVLPGPLTFLLLAKDASGDPLDRAMALAEAYAVILAQLDGKCVGIQLDEPCLCTDLPDEARRAYVDVYARLRGAVKDSALLLATYFGPLGENLELALSLPVDAVHLDLVRGAGQLEAALERLPGNKALSLGVVDGRNVWRTDLDAALGLLRRAREALGPGRVNVSASCSLLHSPMDVAAETGLDPELRSWMAFAVQKCAEVAALKSALETGAEGPLFVENRAALAARAASPRVRDEAVRGRAAQVDEAMLRRPGSAATRTPAQRARLGLPLLPSTTIGSYPQTAEIRSARLALRKGEIDPAEYARRMREQVELVVRRQEELGLDVLVHGEPERNDMVEYFGQQLAGFCFTSGGWVQSYGSRCVKPPVIYGDVSRPGPMTVEWATYAQSLTKKPMKGMLTGPVTILCWSFVRDDLPREEVCRQIALAVRDEVRDLEAAGIAIVQIDEAALREGMPLRSAERDGYLRWAVDSFRLAAGGAGQATQVHSHMCYSEFNSIMGWIAAMDADVVSIEASRSNMELLDAFEAAAFPSDIGPGVYDIHSPRVPTADEMEGLLEKALRVVPAARLWVNPDCGLKTRAWPETLASLANMVEAAERVRARLSARREV